jgi:peptide chain release factor 1
MFERLADLAAEHAQLEKDLADPAIHSDQDRARTLGRRYGELTPVVQAYTQWQQTSADEATARELAHEDSSFGAEAVELAAQREELEQRLNTMLVPRDPNDDKDVILEVKAGEGGEESALFAGDLLRMYQRYAERHGWKTEILDSTMTGLGGYKDVTMAVKARGADGAWSHRVQRVPATESQGRIHTSAAGVLVLPEADPVEVSIDPNDLKIDVFRSSGPGGQSVNTTDSAVRITHLPTGVVVAMQEERSQHRNRTKAMALLRSRILDAKNQKLDADRAQERRSQVGSGDRSQRIRTYNFPQGRLTDHRINLTLYSLDRIMEGEGLDEVIDGLTAERQAELLAAQAVS